MKDKDIYLGLLDNIENEIYGLHDFQEKEKFYPTLKEVQIYKENLIKEFYKYKKEVLISKKNDDIKNLFKALIIIYSIKYSYIKADSSDFDENFKIGDIDEIVDLYADGFKDYLLGYGY